MKHLSNQISKNKLSVICLLIGLQLTFLSCNEKRNFEELTKDDAKYQKITVDSKNIFYDNIFDLIGEVDIKPLNNLQDQEFQLGIINNLIKLENLFFFTDDKHQIFSSDEQGNIKKLLSNYGHGPNQYREITYFTVNEEKGNIYLYDFQKQRFLIYDINLNFLGIESIAYNFKSFRFYKSNLFLFSAKHTNKIGEKIVNHDLIVLDKNRNIKVKSIPFDSSKFPKIRLHKLNPFFKYKTELLFNDLISDTIYNLSSSEVKPEMVFQYKNNSLSKEFKEKPHHEIINELKTKSTDFKDYDLLSNLNAVGENHLIFNYSNNSQNIFSFYSLDNDRTINYRFPINYKNPGLKRIFNPYLFDDTFFVSTIYHTELSFLKEQYEKKYGKSDFSKNIDSLISNHKVSNTPFILKYRIKKF